MRNSPLRDAVLLDALDLPVGESSGMLTCPSCKGGLHGDISYNVSRVDEGVLFNCYRSSCGFRGFLPTAAVLLDPSKPRAERLARPYTGEYNLLTQFDRKYFGQRFDLVDLPEFSIGFDAYGRYVMAIFDARGRTRGYLIRRRGWGPGPWQVDCPRPGDSAGPKTALYMDAPGIPMLSWYFPPNPHTSRIVLVEDCISAMKVAQAGMRGVALVGTNLDNDKVRELSQMRPDEVLIALDPDATSTAFRMARTHGLAFKKVRVVPLEHDLKDTPAADIHEVLSV